MTRKIVFFPGSESEAPCAALPAFSEPAPDGLPGGYSPNAEGIFQPRSGGGEEQVPVRICSPLIVSVKDPDGIRHEVMLDARDVSKGPLSVLDALFNRGFESAPAGKAAQSVADLFATWRAEVRYLRSDRLGWTDR